MSSTSLARVAGVLLGAGVAVSLLVAARPSTNFSRLPASASFTVPVTGELEVTPAPPHPFLRATALSAGGPRAGASFSLRNQTGTTLGVGFRARAPTHQLDGLLRIRLRAGTSTLADTTLQGLRHGSASSLRLRSGSGRRVSIEAWIPAATNDYEGRTVDVELTPTLRPPG